MDVLQVFVLGNVLFVHHCWGNGVEPMWTTLVHASALIYVAQKKYARMPQDLVTFAEATLPSYSQTLRLGSFSTGELFLTRWLLVVILFVEDGPRAGIWALEYRLQYINAPAGLTAKTHFTMSSRVIDPRKKTTLHLIDRLIDCLVNIKDETGEFLLRLEDGRVIDTKGWNDWEVSHECYRTTN